MPKRFIYRLLSAGGHVMSGFHMERLGVLMEPEPGNALEVEGVLNPGAVRGRDGQLYLFPRMVAKGNYSRIGIARVLFDKAGDPTGVERMGIALEPEAEYELRPGGGGCEDPRVTYVEPLRHYTMTYVALTARGPRIAIATSEDLLHWERHGLVTFEPFEGIEFDGVDNKDSTLFPDYLSDPSGQPALALLHRPLFPGTRPEEKVRNAEYSVKDLHRESIWISYLPMSNLEMEASNNRHFTSHRCLASPVANWERLKIGTGTPPVLTKHGWLMLYHGVHKSSHPSIDGRRLSYAAGVMVLAKDRPDHVLFRSAKPVLSPELPEERHGAIANVVFPTGIDRRDDLGTPNRIDVYYGMADDRIGVARMEVPELLTQDLSSDKEGKEAPPLEATNPI